jgi:hypothetical protein
MTTLADIYKQRVSYTPTDPINVNNNISMGYRPNLDFRMGGTRSGLFPPSRSMIGGQGFSKSPFLEDVSNVAESIYNQAIVPTYNTIAKNVDPFLMGFKSYLGGDTSPVLGTLDNVDINLTGKKTTTEQPQTLTQEIQSDIDNLLEKKDEYPDVSLQSNLLSNQEIKDKNIKPNLLNTFESTPAKEGGFTYNLSVTDGQGITDKKQTTEQTTDNVKVDDKEQKVKVTGVDDAPVTDSSVEAVPTSDNKELTPTSSFMKKFENFAKTEFGQDFFANLLSQSSPQVGKPQSFGANFGQAYQKARELQDARDKKNDESDAISKGTINGNGLSAGLFSDKGKLYATVDGVKYFEKDFEKVFGKNYQFRSFGQQTFGILNAKQMSDLDTALTQDENSLTSFVNYLSAVGDTNTGVSRIADNFLARIKIMLGGELSQEQFNLLLADAELPALIAQSRVELAGPGVLTDQDFIRLLETIGGDVNAYQNPQIVKDRISDLISKKYATYKRNVDRYNGNVKEQYGQLGYEERELLEFDKEQLGLIDVDAQIKMGVFDPSSYPVNELVSLLNDPSVKSSSKEIIVEYLEGQEQ